MRALGVEAGDEVITVSHTAVPTVAAVESAGGVPVLVDVDPVTMTMDATRIEERITPRTRAVVPVHLYGHPCDMDPIVDVARRHGLKVLEDAAQAHGARYRSRSVGSLGDAGAFSFYPTKNLGAVGDGGVVTTDDAAIADRLRKLRAYGQTSRYVHASKGTNSRLDELQAALLRVKLPHLNGWNAARRARAALYDRLLDGVEKPTAAAWAEHVYHLYVVQAGRRDALQAELGRRGIGTLIHYPIPVHRQEGYRELANQARYLPVTERIAGRILSLPLYPELPISDVEQVARAVSGIARQQVTA